MKKCLSILPALALALVMLLCGGCGGSRAAGKLVNDSTEALVHTVNDYLAGETDAKTAHDGIAEIARQFAEEKAQPEMQKLLEKNVDADAAVTMFESNLQLTLSAFNHYLLRQAGYEKGLVTAEALAEAEAALRESLGGAVHQGK